MEKNYPDGYGWKGRLLFSLLRNLICFPVFFLWGKGIYGRGNIPHAGPFLVVANHQSFFDFLFVTLALRKFSYVSGFIKAKYYDLPVFSFFLKYMAQVRADEKCLPKAIEVLELGHPLILFPEGTRTKSGGIGEVYPGIGYLSKKFPYMPILPMGINGAFEIWPWNSRFPRWFRWGKISLKIDKPLTFANFEGEEQDFAHLVMQRVAKQAGKTYKERGG